MNNSQETKQQKSPKKTGDKQKKDTRFQPGQSGNPNGRPPGTYSLLTILKNELQKCPEGQDKKTYGDLIVKRMLKEAIEKGDQQQIKLIWNYLEGMPRQGFDFSGNPLLVKVIRSGGEDNQIIPTTR